MKRNLAISVTLLAGICCTAVNVRAEFAVVDLRTDVSLTGSFNQLIGWEFIPNVNIAVTKLGFFDGVADGFATSHDVGIFDVATESLLVSGLIASGKVAPIEGPPVLGFAAPIFNGGYRYVDVTETTLIAGRSYAVVGTNAGYVDRTPSWLPSHPDRFKTASEINFVQERLIFEGPAVLAFPINTVTETSEIATAFQFNVVPEPPFPGDCNGDQVVDFADLGILLNHYNQPGTFSTGDFDDTGEVDIADLGILLNNYNQHTPGLAAATVPEPSTLALATLGTLGLLIGNRRKR